MSQIIKNINSMSLAPQKSAALKSLDDESRQIIQAALAGPMKEADYDLTVDAITEAIGATYAKAGQAAKAEVYMVYAQEIYSVVTSKFPTCTIEELKIAFNNGVYDEYGEYFGLHPKAFIHFVRSYMTSQKRTKAREDFKAKAELLSAPDRDLNAPKYWQANFWTDELKVKWKEETNKFYRYYLDDNMLYQATPEACYWLLQHIGMIKVTEGYADVLFKNAQARLRVEVCQNKANRSTEYIKRTLQDISTGDDEDVNNEVRFIATRIALMNFFRKQKKKNITSLFN